MPSLSATADLNHAVENTGPLKAFTSAIIAVLDELHEFLSTLSTQDYCACVPSVFGAGIGDHVRHSLDHIRVLVNGLESGKWDYEARDRGGDVETDPVAAMCAIREYRENIHQMGSRSAHSPVRVSMMAASDGPAWETRSSLERELAFVLSHTIHHNAMIAVAATALGKRVPERFGYAPATTAYLQSSACVPSR